MGRCTGYEVCACCLFYTFLASVSASSGLRYHAPLWLRNTNLGSNNFCMGMNLRLFHCKYEQHVFSDMQRDCICNSCPPGPFLLIWDTMIKWFCECWLLFSGYLWAAAVCTSRSEQQVSHCYPGVCLRCWNKCFGPLPLVATAFEQTLQQTVVCSTDETVPF